MLDTNVGQMNLYSMHHDKCKFVMKFIDLVNLFNLFPLEVVQKCQNCQLCVLRENYKVSGYCVKHKHETQVNKNVFQ